jgi:hypothetical protein
VRESKLDLPKIKSGGDLSCFLPGEFLAHFLELSMGLGSSRVMPDLVTFHSSVYSLSSHR